MNKFLRLVEDNLPDSTAKIPTDVLEDIKNLLKDSKLKYSLEYNNYSNSGIITLNNMPKFKITITSIKDEEEDNIISAAADIAKGPTRTRLSAAAAALAAEAERKMKETLLNLQKQKQK